MYKKLKAYSFCYCIMIQRKDKGWLGCIYDNPELVIHGSYEYYRGAFSGKVKGNSFPVNDIPMSKKGNASVQEGNIYLCKIETIDTKKGIYVTPYKEVSNERIILTQLSPETKDAIFKMNREYGCSREQFTVIALCSQIKMRILQNRLEVTTPVNQWHIDLSNEQQWKLYHVNAKARYYEKNNNFQASFHRQTDVIGNNPNDYIGYILQHDLKICQAMIKKERI